MPLLMRQEDATPYKQRTLAHCISSSGGTSAKTHLRECCPCQSEGESGTGALTFHLSPPRYSGRRNQGRGMPAARSSTRHHCPSSTADTPVTGWPLLRAPRERPPPPEFKIKATLLCISKPNPRENRDDHRGQHIFLGSVVAVFRQHISRHVACDDKMRGIWQLSSLRPAWCSPRIPLRGNGEVQEGGGLGSSALGE